MIAVARTEHPYASSAQLQRLDEVLREVLPRNSLQRSRLGESRRVRGPGDLTALPLMTKTDLVSDALAAPPFGTNLTYDVDRYVRYHQTSGTTGSPLPVLDTAASWEWWGRCWGAVFRVGDVGPRDRLFFAFSFGPFIGFWAAHEGAHALGAMCIPAGGASSLQRIRAILDAGATVVLCTPSYALHLAEVAAREGIDLRSGRVRLVIVAGEVGGSIPATRAQITAGWGADVLDHAGATEVGAWGIGCSQGLCVNEEEFIAEVLDATTGRVVEPGSGGVGELVMTNLGRAGWPVVRYRTGDLVRPMRGHGPLGSGSLILKGGILGRCDDMITIRGLNVFPSALEDVIRGQAGASEFRITATSRGRMDELVVDVEGDESLADRIRVELRVRIGIRTDVRAVPVGTLPRWEGKARRFVKRTA